MNIPLKNKSSVDDIKFRFDNDVERFSKLQTGQQNMIDASLIMSLITEAAAKNNPSAQHLLDIGCGAGNNTLKLLEKVSPLDCDLVDLSKPMLERAAARIGEINDGQIQIFQGDFRNVALPNEHYDIIIAAAVLHHLRDEQDWEHAFRKIYQLTAPGGSIWISDFVCHDNEHVQEMMWNRFGNHLESLGGREYREKVFAYIDREDSPRPLTFQLDLLRKVGFASVEILHKNSCFVGFGAIKGKNM
jgi:tRNA (cmo5U34)-methyltransferase